MKTPLNWISLYTPLTSLLASHNTTELAHEYSIHTAEIDGIESHFLDRVVIGQVISCEKHPDSTKLSIVRVDLGEHGEETILTGAPNIVDATYVPVAMVGAVLGGDFTIGERRMAGMMSRGMICGADEIGLATESDGGIMILENIWQKELLENMIGHSLFDLTLSFPGIDGANYNYTLRDTTFEIDNKFITNRPDLFGIYGNAREWGAVFGLDFTEYVREIAPLSRGEDSSVSVMNQGGFVSETSHTNPPTPLDRGAQNTVKLLPLNIQTDRCLAYNAIRMENISVSESPFGIALMMQRAGLAPKMDLVDITNLILTEFGQPMHVFDADKVVGTITVRLAKIGEKLIALNGIEYELTTEDMVIADDNWAIALAGVIGGMDSAVSLETRNVIWESATFDAVSVRLSAQRHGVRTDASTRYEKSLDPLLASFATTRIYDYLVFLSKNINVTGIGSYLNDAKVNNIKLDVTYDFIDSKAGARIPHETVNKILTSLGFDFSVIPGLSRDPGNNNESSPAGSPHTRGWQEQKEQQEWQEHLHITIPSWRASKDVSIKEDIAEEIIRIYGYDNITPSQLGANSGISARNTNKHLRDISLDYWKGQNWNEVYNYSFTNTSLDAAIGYDSMTDSVAIQNAFNVEYTHMRRSLSVRLFDNIAKNRNIQENLRFYEIGKVYSKERIYTTTITDLLKDIKIKPYGELPMIAGVSTADSIESLRRSLETYLVETIGYVPPLHQSNSLPYLHPGVSGEYREGESIFIRFGRVHPATAEAFDIPADALYWEADIWLLLSHFIDREVRVAPISRFQSIPRELSFVMDESTQTGQIALAIESHHPWISTVTVGSIYRDETRLWKDRKSVNFIFSLTSHEHTISDDEALKVQNEIIENMKTKGCEIRG